ncbi:MAG: hypothetical protein ACKPKO_24745, partial [Candidatus Fonsibacter sp.]
TGHWTNMTLTRTVTETQDAWNPYLLCMNFYFHAFGHARFRLAKDILTIFSKMIIVHVVV